jgi:ribosomal protein S18 acetylase RimI-like enzyme
MIVMANIKIITKDYRKYIDDRNIQELVDGFISHHKKIYKKYDPKDKLKELYNKDLEQIIDAKIDVENYILCFAYDEDQKRAVGFATGIRSSKKSNDKDGIVRDLSTIYLQTKFRGLISNGKKVSKILYEEFANQVKQRGGGSIELGVYNRNDDALKFYASLGFEIKPENYQKGISIFKSLDVFLKNREARMKRSWELVSLRNAI